MPQVNGDNLLHQQIVKRTIEALQAQDEAFAIEYETASAATASSSGCSGTSACKMRAYSRSPV